jgi:hypothetical protein
MAECGHRICMRDLEQCHVCQSLVCPRCDPTCAICGAPHCPAHVAGCVQCGQEYCSACVNSAGVCATCAAAEVEGRPVARHALAWPPAPEVNELIHSYRWRVVSNRRYDIYIGDGAMKALAVVVVERRPEGDRVVRGQRIAVISDAYGVFRSAPHLHFDISPTRVLEGTPGDWPGMDMTRIERDYANPRLFIYGNRPVNP